MPGITFHDIMCALAVFACVVTLFTVRRTLRADRVVRDVWQNEIVARISSIEEEDGERGRRISAVERAQAASKPAQAAPVTATAVTSPKPPDSRLDASQIESLQKAIYEVDARVVRMEAIVRPAPAVDSDGDRGGSPPPATTETALEMQARFGTAVPVGQPVDPLPAAGTALPSVASDFGEDEETKVRDAASVRAVLASMERAPRLVRAEEPRPAVVARVVASVEARAVAPRGTRPTLLGIVAPTARPIAPTARRADPPPLPAPSSPTLVSRRDADPPESSSERPLLQPSASAGDSASVLRRYGELCAVVRERGNAAGHCCTPTRGCLEGEEDRPTLNDGVSGGKPSDATCSCSCDGCVGAVSCLHQARREAARARRTASSGDLRQGAR